MPDSELLSQLCGFMQSVPLLWSQEQLMALHSSGRVHAEFRGNESSPLSFDLEVLEHEIANGAGYLNLLVSVSDSSRQKGATGSSWLPLTASIIWRASGEIEMIAPRTDHQKTFVMSANYAFKPTAEGLSLRSNLAAGGGLTRR